MAKVKIPGKWIAGLEADTPLTVAARRVLKVRLWAVRKLLPLAARPMDESVEALHQLRIATRRASAAIRVFEPALKPRAAKKARRIIRKIRRAAAEARTCDVHRHVFQQMQAKAVAAARPILDHVARRVVEDRQESQKKIARTARRRRPRRMRRLVRGVLRSIRDPRPDDLQAREAGSSPTLMDAAQKVLPQLVDRAREAGGPAADLSVLEHIHALRLAGKRLRYSMEVLSPCLGETFRSRTYPLIHELQEHLGPINDSHEIVQRLERYLQELPPPSTGPIINDSTSEQKERLRGGLSHLCQLYRQEREARVRHFAQWWKQFGPAFFEHMDGLLANLGAQAAPANVDKEDGEDGKVSATAGRMTDIVAMPAQAAAIGSNGRGRDEKS